MTIFLTLQWRNFAIRSNGKRVAPTETLLFT